ncbi:hypothetical protein SynBIOSE41_02803 [Synechococcus sp. BIOS-E4-1]|nr:hypothetical protein SynBIOSE41_02803 [Synechococcus sp. BIOS-E4-1]
MVLISSVVSLCRLLLWLCVPTDDLLRHSLLITGFCSGCVQKPAFHLMS